MFLCRRGGDGIRGAIGSAERARALRMYGCLQQRQTTEDNADAELTHDDSA
jgi:hypothetical protein